MSFPDRFKIAMGRSFKLGILRTFPRMGASCFLSRKAAGSRCKYGAQSSGGSRRDDAGSGGCAFCFPLISADKGADERRSIFNMPLPYAYALADGSSYDCSGTLSFDRSIGMLQNDINTHLQLRGGSGVDARRPFIYRRCRNIKEM